MHTTITTINTITTMNKNNETTTKNTYSQTVPLRFFSNVHANKTGFTKTTSKPSNLKTKKSEQKNKNKENKENKENIKRGILVKKNIVEMCKRNTNSSILLSQLIYWSDKGKDKNWIWKTYLELEKETGLSLKQLKTAKKHLENLNLILTEKKVTYHGASPVAFERKSQGYQITNRR